jgi:hypothetical protein
MSSICQEIKDATTDRFFPSKVHSVSITAQFSLILLLKNGLLRSLARMSEGKAATSAKPSIVGKPTK